MLLECIHKEVVQNIVDFLIENNLKIINLSYSPIKGPEGNIEYLVYFTKDINRESNFELEDIEKVINESHNLL